VKQIEGEAPMFEKLELTRMAQSLASHAGTRLAAIAQNVANADTPKYTARDVVPFEAAYTGQGEPMRATRPGHIGASSRSEWKVVPSGGPMSPNGNDVSLDLQMMKAVEARQSHEMALAIYRNTSAIIRTSLGRNA
jgi:flagellar basal-body rod protein FlgB